MIAPKILVQIPCYNEEESIAKAIKSVREALSDIRNTEILVINDGSGDLSYEKAKEASAEHIISFKRNKGLAMAFKTGLDYAINKLDADIVVNYDADNQYKAEDIPRLLEPILQEKAHIVIGARNIYRSENYTFTKKLFHKFGTRILNFLINTELSDPVSGFRALSREAAEQINIVSDFSYTTEMLIQAEYKRLRVVEIPIETNITKRKSRLFKSIPHFLINTGATIIRTYAMYRPLRFFGSIGIVLCLTGLIPILRFLLLFFLHHEPGKIQSLIIGGTLFMSGVFFFALAILADIVSRNRKLIEEILYKINKNG